MKQKKAAERGQVLIIMALAAVGLFAIVGLAIDGSNKFSDQRHAQNAADTAALAGSLAKVNDDVQWKFVATDRAYTNGYNNDLVTNTVVVNACSETGVDCGAYTGEKDYVKVVINSYVNTTFARVIGIAQMQNSVQAVAKSRKEYIGELYGGASIVGLAPDQCKTIWFSGTATPTIKGGGVFSNSNKDCGVTISGSTNITMDGSLDMVAAGYVKNGNPPLGGIAGGIAGGADQYDYPPLDEALPKYTCDYSYSSFPPSGVTNLSPGTYCVNGAFKLNAKDKLTGTGVTIVMQSGGITWNGGATINLSAPTSGDLAGMLIYAPMSNTSAMSFNGNGSSVLTGTIFMPATPITYNGTANLNPSYVQIIGYTIEITGTNTTNVIYQDGDNWDLNLPAQVGIMN